MSILTRNVYIFNKMLALSITGLPETTLLCTKASIHYYGQRTFLEIKKNINMIGLVDYIDATNSIQNAWVWQSWGLVD